MARGEGAGGATLAQRQLSENSTNINFAPINARVKSGSRNTDQQERLQRVRIGVTGLAAVFLVVLSAGALRNSASDETPVEQQSNVEATSGLPDIIGANVTAEATPQEPLAELGVAPSTGPTDNGAVDDAKGKGP